MILALIVLQIVVLVALAVLLRRPAQAAAPTADPRAAELPDQIVRLDGFVRETLAGMRGELPVEAGRSRRESAEAATELRREVVGNIATLGGTLKSGLDALRTENSASAAALREELEGKMRLLSHNFADHKQETGLAHAALQIAVGTKLNELMGSNSSHQDKLRSAVQERLEQLNKTNADKLEEMRATVDEKLHATLHTRLTESFGQVTDQLSKVHTGLGEMSKLSEGVDGLSRIFTNVKSRGGVAEVLLGQLIAQILAPSQYLRNAQVKLGTQEAVEYAVRFPAAGGETLLPIDAKFPREAWERLQTAYEGGASEDILAAGRAFESAIKIEGKRICSKYINEPVTTPYAIMFLPTESLYAEVVRRDGLQAELQQNCHVTIAGPSTLSAILISFQMGFHMLNLQKKGDDVWKVLAGTRTEFDKFGALMGKMEKQVGTVQNTIHDLNVRTRAIHKNLREVGEADEAPGNLLSFDGVAPLLAAGGEEG